MQALTKLAGVEQAIVGHAAAPSSRSDAPGVRATQSAESTTCGTGTVSGFGAATSTFDLIALSFDPATGCGTVSAERVITLLSDGSTLTLLETGTACWPGSAGTAPGPFISFGNPIRLNLTFTVESGTGVFASLNWKRNHEGQDRGDSGHVTLSGTLDP